MIELILKKRHVTGENYKKCLLFYRAIAHIYHTQKPRKGATREDIITYFRNNNILYSPDEISRFLQYLKENGLIINRDKDYWVCLY